MTKEISHIRYISLIRLEGGESILNIPYAELTVDPDLIAGFVTAVIIFAKTPIRTIRKAAYDILIEVGETVLVLLVVDPVPDEEPYRKRLRAILDAVEAEHGDKLRSFEGDIRRFREFALDVLVQYPFSFPDLELIPIRMSKGMRIPFRVGKVDKKLEQLEAFINGKRTLAEILNLIDLPEEEVVALISILQRYNWINFKKRLSEDDVLERVDCPESSVERIRQQYGDPVDELLQRFGDELTVREVLDTLPFDRNAMRFLISKLVEANCLKLKGSI